MQIDLPSGAENLAFFVGLNPDTGCHGLAYLGTDGLPDSPTFVPVDPRDVGVRSQFHNNTHDDKWVIARATAGVLQGRVAKPGKTPEEFLEAVFQVSSAAGSCNTVVWGDHPFKMKNKERLGFGSGHQTLSLSGPNDQYKQDVALVETKLWKPRGLTWLF